MKTGVGIKNVGGVRNVPGPSHKKGTADAFAIGKVHIILSDNHCIRIKRSFYQASASHVVLRSDDAGNGHGSIIHIYITGRLEWNSRFQFPNLIENRTKKIRFLSK